MLSDGKKAKKPSKCIPALIDSAPIIQADNGPLL